MAPKRDTYHHGNLRNAVVEVGLRFLDEEAPLTMRGLAREIGVNHRAIAREFRDLRGVQAALSLHILTSMREALMEVNLEELSLRESLIALGVAYAKYGVTHKQRYVFFSGPRLNADGRHPELEVGFNAIFVPFTTALMRGIASGELREHDVLGESVKLISAVHGFVHVTCLGRWTIPAGGFPKWSRRFVALPVDGLLQGLRVNPP